MIINRMAGGGGSGGLPEFTYTGTYSLIDDGVVDGVQNWRIKFLTSGTLTFTKLGGNIDLFLVGGGGGGFKTNYAGGGGGGGYTHTNIVSFVALNTEYSIVVGAGSAASSEASGGASSAFGLAANGGVGGHFYAGADGGSGGGGANGGTGGTNGGNGGNGTGSDTYTGGTGQGTTTREFSEAAGTLYATGGHGKTGSVSGAIKTANTGDGGDGTLTGTATAGASGIVVIRNHRAA